MKFTIRMKDGSDISDEISEQCTFLFNQRNIVNTLALHGHTNVTSNIIKHQDRIDIIATIFYRSNISWDIDSIQMTGAYIISSIVYER